MKRPISIILIFASVSFGAFTYRGPLSDATSTFGVNASGVIAGVDLSLTTPSLIYSLDHDLFAGFVANEHVDHSTVSILAGGILSGGGDLTVSRTLTLNHSDVDHDQLTNTHNLTTDIDHGLISGLTDDDHSQYLLLSGRGGQTVQDNVYIGMLDGSARYDLRIYQGTNGTAGQFASLYADYDNLYLYNDDGAIIFPKAADSAHSVRIQEAGSPYESVKWWFDGSSATGTGMWISSPANAGNMSFQFGTNDGSSTFHIRDSASGSLFSVTDQGNTNVGTVTAGTWNGTALGANYVPDHGNLNNMNTASYYHLTQANHTDLTDSGDSTLHYHATDRSRANHTGTQTAATISDFDTEVGNHVDVAANTTHRSSNGTDHTYIDQDVATTASPTWANVSLGTGELTTGSINRASGTMTLEIGGSSIVDVASTGATVYGSASVKKSGYANVNAYSFSTTLAEDPRLFLVKSHNNTLDTYTATIDTEVLGSVNFYAVDSGSSIDSAAAIKVTQVGAAGTTIPSKMVLSTWTASSGENTNQLVLYNDGNCGFGVATPLEDVHAADTVRADTAFNLNGTDGVSGTLELDDGSTEKITLVFTGGILTSRTVAATTGSVLADWTD